MSLFVIGDTHLSLSVNKPMDIFNGWQDYTQKLEKNWRETVKEEDTVVIPGDISWGMSLEQALADFKFIDSLPGKKIILKGNHDYWWSTLTKAENFFAENEIKTIKILNNNHYEYEGIGICGSRGWINDGSEPEDAKVIHREAMRLERSIQSALEASLYPVVFLHYPPIFLDSKNDEIMEVLEKYGIDLCFYGHLHGGACRLAHNGVKNGIDFRLISSDFLQFMPLDITETVQNAKK